MRRLTKVGDGLIALLGAFALRAMGATWTEVAVVVLVAAGMSLLVRPMRSRSRRDHHRMWTRRRRGRPPRHADEPRSFDAQ